MTTLTYSNSLESTALLLRYPQAFPGGTVGWIRWMAIALGLLGMIPLNAIAAVPEPLEFSPTAIAAVANGEVLISQATATLRIGSSGDDVRALQEQLAALGYYSGPISGYFGSQTEAAVMAFQRSNGLSPDGVVGVGTQSALFGSNTPDPALEPDVLIVRRGASGEIVVALQQRLNELGYYGGPLDGDFGATTEQAVIQFQRNNGLVADGIVGFSTEDALRRSDAIAASASPPPSTPATQPTPSDSRPTEVQILQLGSSGRAVIALQSQLRELGYFNSRVNGTYDAVTRDAVMAFQSAMGLIPDGIAGPQTLAWVDREFFNLEAATVPQGQAASVTPSATPTTTFPPATATSATTTQPNPPTVVAPAAPIYGTAPPPLVTVPSPPVATPPTQPVSMQSQPAAGQVVIDGEAFSILELQRRLQARGLYQGPLDGVMNPQTQQAIAAAQQRYGLSQADLFRGQF